MPEVQNNRSLDAGDHNPLGDSSRRHYRKSRTREAKANQEIEEALAETRRRRDQLIATVVHDFRGPLTSLLGFSQLIERALSQGKPCEHRHVQVIAREAKRLDEMVDELADLSLIEMGRLEMEKQPTDIVALAQELIEERQAATQLKLSLEARIRPLVGNWDSNRLAQALKYLVDNAVRYAPEQSQIAMTIEPIDAEVRTTIADQGHYIPKEFLKLVFEPFSRFHRERRTKGMGIGPHIAKGIVEAHGGRIWLESEQGKGNRVIFLLPR